MCYFETFRLISDCREKNEVRIVVLFDSSEPPSKKAKGMIEPAVTAKKPKEDKPKKPKAVGGKKAIAQIKGQSKITAFMRV